MVDTVTYLLQMTENFGQKALHILLNSKNKQDV